MWDPTPEQREEYDSLTIACRALASERNKWEHGALESTLLNEDTLARIAGYNGALIALHRKRIALLTEGQR